jgi:hypothetical protein
MLEPSRRPPNRWAVACFVAGLIAVAAAGGSLLFLEYVDWDAQLYSGWSMACAYVAFGAGPTALALAGVARRAALRGSGGSLATAGLVLGGVAGMAALLLESLVFPVRFMEAGPTRLLGMGRMQKIGSGLRDYAEQHGGRLPPGAINGPNGEPLLSWRVAVLPYLEQGPLYRRFKMDEPWDGPTNRPLLEEMPLVFRRPGARGLAPPGYTYYRAFTGPGTAFPLIEGLRLPGDFPDGADRTLLVVEADEAVPWTQPEGLRAAADRPLPALGGHGRRGCLVVLADGTIRSLNFGAEPGDGPPVSEATVRKLITPAGAEEIDPKEFP